LEFFLKKKKKKNLLTFEGSRFPSEGRKKNVFVFPRVNLPEGNMTENGRSSPKKKRKFFFLWVEEKENKG